MLYPALQYKQQLLQIIDTIKDNKKYKYCRYQPKFEKANPYSIEWVSVDKDNKVIGFITYSYSDIIPKEVFSFTIASFDEKASLFGYDLYKIIYKLLIIDNNKYINFKVMKGNPIEETYKKFCSKFFEEGPILSQQANRYRISRDKLKEYLNNKTR